MKAIFNLNETDVTAIAIGQKVSITSEARPDLSVEGSIVQISRSADVRSRSFEVKALFANTPDRWFRPGMFAESRPESLHERCNAHGAEYRHPD